MSTEPKRRGVTPTRRFFAKAVTVKGVRYPSISAAADAYGIEPRVVINRCGLGWELLDALTDAVRQVDRPVTVRGTRYRSVSAACEALGVNYPTVLHRLNRGWSPEQAFGEKREKAHPVNARAVRVGNRRYNTMAEAAEAFGLSASVVRTRLAAGWSITRTFKTPPQRSGPVRAVTVNGKRYRNLQAAASAHGRKIETVYSRLDRGWSLERALNAPFASSGAKTHAVRFKGRTYESLDAAARALGLSARLLRSLRSRGFSQEAALTQASERARQLGEQLRRRAAFKAEALEHETRSRAVEFNGVRYEGYASLARAYQVPVASLKGRLRLGWTLEQALGLAPAPKLVRPLRSVTVAGETFASIAAAARHFGVPWHTARYRLQSGATPEQAFGLAPFKPRLVNTGKPLTVAGERFASINQACQRFKKSTNLIQRRLATGESPDQAFDFAPPPLEHAKVVVDGRAFRFVAAAARYFKVDPVRVHSLVNQRQISAAEAIRIERERMAG